MAYRLVVNGVAITCDSPDEALALAQRAGSARRGQSPGNLSTRAVSHASPRKSRTVQLLRAVREAGSGGIPSERLAKKMEVDEAQALGPITISMNRALQETGLDVNEVIRRGRDSEGTRRWYPGPQIETAISKLGS